MVSFRIIRTLSASLLLVLFALAITPKVAIHALVAHHEDRHLALGFGPADQYNKAGFHCATDSLVVEFPFLDHSLSIQLGIRPSLQVLRFVRLEEPFSSSYFIFGLRGPPPSFSI